MTETITLIPIDLIDPCPVNPRKTFDEAQLCELSVSITKMGVTNPIIVRPGWSPVNGNGTAAEHRYELICGHRRAEAAKRSGLAEVPAIIRELNDAEALDLAIVDNLQRVDLSPMEEAEGYAMLMKVAGAGPDELQDQAGEIALKVGKTLRYVIQRLKLLSLIPEARDVMRRGYLSLDCALLIARLQADDQERALIYAIDHRKASRGKTLAERCDDAIKNLQGDIANWLRPSTEKEVREWIASNITLSLKQAPWALDDAALLSEAGACTSCPKRVGNNAVLFGDLTAQENTCTDPGCYESKQKAFVKLTVKEAAESGAPVLKLSTSQSCLPIKEGSTLEKTTFKQGQWIEAKKGSCKDTHRGVTQEGEFKTVCVNQKCTVHKHRVEQPQQRLQNGNDPKVKADREAKQKAYVVSETPIRRAVYEAIRAQKISTASLIRVLIEKALEGCGMDFCEQHEIKVPGSFWENCAASVHKYIQSVPEKDLPGLAVEVLCYDELTVHEWEFNRVEQERKRLWDIAKAFGVDPEAIAAKLAKPAAAEKSHRSRRRKAAKPKKRVLSKTAKERIAKAMKERWAKAQKAGAK